MCYLICCSGEDQDQDHSESYTHIRAGIASFFDHMLALSPTSHLVAWWSAQVDARLLLPLQLNIGIIPWVHANQWCYGPAWPAIHAQNYRLLHAAS